MVGKLKSDSTILIPDYHSSSSLSANTFAFVLQTNFKNHKINDFIFKKYRQKALNLLNINTHKEKKMPKIVVIPATNSIRLNNLLWNGIFFFSFIVKSEKLQLSHLMYTLSYLYQKLCDNTIYKMITRN